MRNAFADEITKLAERDERVVVLSADIGNRLFDKFKSKFPNRFLNTGVAEANTISMAAGLAAEGYRPVCYTITPFITYRCFEQIRVDVCYHKMPVTIVGTGSGLSYASLGPTHHSCEDIAIMRALPDMKVAAPSDANEVRACLRTAFSLSSPVYIRIGKKGESINYSEPPVFEWGNWDTRKKGDDICLLSAGNMLPETMIVSDKLSEAGISAQVINCTSIKPLDEKMLREIFNEFKVIAILEEHSLIGGFSSSIAEWYVDNATMRQTKIIRFGTKDFFLHNLGEQEYARKQYGIDFESIVMEIIEKIKG